eukprot:SAG31_NODE_27614_length_423_cov_0.790123_1_plen_31_part_10
MAEPAAGPAPAVEPEPQSLQTLPWSAETVSA